MQPLTAQAHGTLLDTKVVAQPLYGPSDDDMQGFFAARHVAVRMADRSDGNAVSFSFDDCLVQ